MKKNEFKKEINKLFKQLCYVNKDGDCKYWKVESFGYDKNDKDAVDDKFFPQKVKDKLLEIIK